MISRACVKQGYVALAGNYVLFPAIRSSPDGKTVMVFSLTGQSRYPSAAYSVLDTGASAFGPVSVAAAGRKL